LYIFIDTETTGINRATDRVVQIAWVLADEIGRIKLEKEYIIRPDGFYIPERASAIHGITTERAKREGKSLVDVLAELLFDASEICYVVAHNVTFDLSFLRREFFEADLTDPFKEVKTICTMMSSASHCRLSKLNGISGYKRPTLQELHFHLFHKYFDGAHEAMADVQACMRCFYELKRLRVITLTSQPPRYLTPDNNFQTAIQEIDRLKAETHKLRTELTSEKALSFEFKEKVDFLYSNDGLFSQALESNDIEWHKAVARHPNCPESILVKLCDGAKEIDLLDCLVSNPSLPIDKIRYIIFDSDYCFSPSLCESAAKNPSCDAEILANILWYSDMELQPIVESNPSYAIAAFETLLQEKAKDKDSADRSSVAEFPNCPDYLLRVLAEDSDPKVRGMVANNSSSRSDVLVELAEDEDENVKELALKNKNHPINKARKTLKQSSEEFELALKLNDFEKLKYFANQASPELGVLIAKNMKCPKYILKILAASNNVDTRLAVAKHSNCLLETYKALSKDNVGSVRLAVASNPDTPVQILKLLSESEFYEYRVKVALNPRTPKAILESLAQDKELKVRRAIKKRLTLSSI
jgi:DNA polymerase III epsilon subunit-like protein